MVAIKELKQFVMLGYLTDEMLGKLLPITDILQYDENEKVFRQGQTADRFYLLEQGKVLLEQRITDTLTISLGAVTPGFSFGWSAMLDGGDYSSEAVCALPCVIYSFKAARLKRIMEEDQSMGFIISRRLLYVLKKRYDARTEQFVKTIKYHPEIADLL